MSNDITTSQDGAVFTITLNHPERGNAVTDGMVIEFTQLIANASSHAEIVVLRGAGNDFCVGRVPQPQPAVEPEAYERRRFSDVVFDCYGAIRAASVPVISVVQGQALGFGCAVAAAADITLASDAAQFQVPEMAHNIMPTMVMSALVDRLPRKAIAYLVYSQAKVNAARALELGLASDVVPLTSLESSLDGLLKAMLKAPPIALRSAKEYIRTAPDMSTPGAVEYARNLHATINSSIEIRRK
jgi:enoyl-CoA hydratase